MPIGGLMPAAARHDAILRELEMRGSLSSAALAVRLGVTTMTVWRDLVALEDRGLLVRVHGGALSLAVAQQQSRDSERGDSRPRPVATIGMIVPTTQYYFPEVIRGASQAAHESNCRLVVGATNYSEEEEFRQAERLIASGVDALMITPQDTLTPDSRLQRMLAETHLPVVMVERSVEDPLAGRLEWVRTDHAHGAEVAVRHLVQQGHLRIALAARPSATVAGLDAGFRRAMGSLDQHSTRALRRDLSHPQLGDNANIAELGDLLDDCLSEGVSAAILLGDADAMAFLDLVIEKGLRVPEDFAVVAYDDEVAAFATVPLTAVAPPKHELGHAAVRLCVDRLKQPEGAAHTPVRMALLPALVVRESTVRPV
ncbi:substrate-binding domain-containing protein [Microbacterium sp. NPDC090014]|uniref:substrate-binding domain-containing protein n=1 Tax=Microbacterium sp. NPDC090014 TaxID=3364205 RepID=UPI0038271DF3